MTIQVVKNDTNKGNKTMLLLPQGYSGLQFKTWLKSDENKAKLEQIKAEVESTGKSQTFEV